MTPFAQLERTGAGVEKSAAVPKFLMGLHRLVRDGAWASMARKTKPDTVLGRTSRMFYNPKGGKEGLGARTVLSKGMLGYGMAGLVGDITGGYKLPFSNLAFAGHSPGYSAMYHGQNAITGLRANSDKNRRRMKQDAMAGGKDAAVQFLMMGNRHPEIFRNQNLYRQAMQHYGIGGGGLMDYYSSGNYSGRPGSRLGLLMNRPQQLIGSEVDKQIFNALHGGGLMKSGSWGQGIMKGLGWLAKKGPKGDGLRNKITEGFRGGLRTGAGAGGILGAGYGGIRTAVDDEDDTLLSGLGKVLKGGLIGAGAGAGIGGAGGAVLGPIGGFGNVAPYAFAGSGLYGLGRAATKDKPYDEGDIRQRGAAATQALLQNRINNMSGMERMALRLDPSMAAAKLEAKMPGTIAAWEAASGSKYRPGWLTRLTGNAPAGTGGPRYYEFDAAGNRHYF